MAKEVNKRFQLEKGKDYDFDISKSGKRKFDLTKDADEEPVIATSAVSGPQSASSDSQLTKDSPNKKSKLWIWIIVVLAVLAALVWWLLSKPSPSATPVLEEPNSTEKVVVPAEDPSEMPASSSESPAEAEAPENPSSEPQTSSQVPVTSSPNQSNLNVTDDIEAEALKVIRGVYGDGDNRKKSLGSRYDAIQSRVNQLKKEGLF